MSNLEAPIPMSDIESVLAWVDSFKLSRPTKKINRDFSDAVLLAEILSVQYPKLVEMHNYPPRNSHALKLNNWLTLNRKVLKKLRLNLCTNTMEQLANSHNGVIERVLLMVREKIRRDEEMNKSMKDAEQNMSSGGSFYEACGDEENVLVVPVKVRVNGLLEVIQQKVINYESYLALKEEFNDAKDTNELLKQKVDHLDNLLNLKQERIEELQKQLDRKQARRKEAESLQNSLQVPFESVPSPVPQLPVCTVNDNPAVNPVSKTPSAKSLEAKPSKEDSKIPVKIETTPKPSTKHILPEISGTDLAKDLIENAINIGTSKLSYTKFPIKTERKLITHVEEEEHPLTEVIKCEAEEVDIDRIKSDVFQEIEIVDEKTTDFDEFKDSVQDINITTTIQETIQNEIKNISNPVELIENVNC